MLYVTEVVTRRSDVISFLSFTSLLFLVTQINAVNVLNWSKYNDRKIKLNSASEDFNQRIPASLLLDSEQSIDNLTADEPVGMKKPETSPLISETEFLETTKCWKQYHFADANVTKKDYYYFARNLNKYSKIVQKSEVAMLLAHIYEQTRGFDRSPHWCAFKKCPFNDKDEETKYTGRGYIHLYGKRNYEGASNAIFGDDTLLKDPNLVSTNDTIAWETAFWFWMRNAHPHANLGAFGQTIALIRGLQACGDKSNTLSFKRLLNLCKCIYKTIKASGSPLTDGCPILTESVAENKVANASSNVAAYISVPFLIILIAALIALFVYIRYRKMQMSVNLSIAFSQKNLEEIGFKSAYEFPANRLILKEELGSGFFGVVVKAEAVGFKTATGEPVVVAVKKAKGQLDTAHQDALLSELKIYLNLGKNLNVINFLGAVTKGELMLIFEFCERGNLRDFLITNRETFVNQLNSETLECEPGTKSASTTSLLNQDLNTYDLMCYAYQISEGMKYLSYRNIVHRDLAARNVLLTKANVAKLCDFGLAKDVYENYGNYCMTTNNPLPLKWMSIEAIRDRVFTSKSDVWAFGVVVWEIFSLGYDPYPGIPVDDRFFTRILDGFRMTRPNYCPKSIFDLMNKCWDIDAKQRPNFEFLARALHDTLDEETQNYYLQLGDDYVKLSECYTNANVYVEMYPSVAKHE